jgi:hypothetical protein
MLDAKSNDSPQLPPLLAYFVEITKRAGESKYASVLDELGHLAVDYVALHDVMPSLVHVTRSATHERLRDVASRHLGLGQLEWRLDGAIIRAAAEGRRDAIHAALADVYTVRDTTHILWGLTIGLALCDHRGGVRR